MEPPKSRAGKRSLTFPAEIRPDLQERVDRYAEPGTRGLVFVGPKGGKLRRQNFRPIWRAASNAAGMPDAHFSATLAGPAPKGAELHQMQHPPETVRERYLGGSNQGPGSVHIKEAAKYR